MTRTRLRLFAAFALLSGAGAVLGSSDSDETPKDIAGYREWTRVNKKPVTVENLSAFD